MKDLALGLEFQVSERFARALKKRKMMQKLQHFWKYHLDFGHQGSGMGGSGHVLNYHFSAWASRESGRQTC